MPLASRRVGLPLLVVLALLLAFGVALAPPLARPALAKSLHWERYDVTIDLHPDGTFTVTEDQVIAFTEGVFSEGYAVIPLDRVEDIDNVRVFEDGQPYRRGGYGVIGSYDVSISGGQLEILWWFEPAEGETRRFTISYDVTGGLRVYDNPETGQPREQLWWRAIDEDFAADIREATVTVNLPQPVSPEQLSLAYYIRGDAEVTYEVVDADTARWVATDLRQGDAFEARLEFPKMTTATAPDWQARDDAQREREERLRPYKALANALMLGVGLLLLVGGTLGTYLIWFTRGRDAPVPVPIDILREPPDDLPPAAVGTLIDERADDHDVIAAIVALGQKRVIQIEERDDEGILGVFGLGREFYFKKLPHDAATLAEHEKALLAAIFGARDEVKLSDIRQRFAEQQERVKTKLYDELVQRGYFPQSPQAVRRMWRGLGLGLLFLSVVGGFFAFGIIGSFAPYVIVPIVAAVIVSLVLIVAGGAMPRKTERGAEAAARWLAFRRYLEEIERWEDLQQAREIFNRYLPYAVAFKLERSWVRKFASVGAPAPEWYGDYGGRPRRAGRLPRHQRGPVIVGPGGGGGDIDLPDLQEVSDTMTRSLQDVSDGLLDLFNEAGEAFHSYSTQGTGSRGGRSGGFGGFSGGGGGFGGGGGGGGRGFR